MTSPAELNSEISEIHFEIHMIYRYQELTFNLVDIGFRYQECIVLVIYLLIFKIIFLLVRKK